MEKHAIKALKKSEILVFTKGPRSARDYEIDTFRLKKIYLTDLKNFIPVNRPSFSSLEKYILKCIKSGWVSSSGKFINEFENSFKKIVSRKFAVAVTSGTAALDIAIKSLKLKT